MDNDQSSIRPREGFNPLMVKWGGPDEPRTDKCSYCGDPFPARDDFVPLILSNEAGWCAEFCDHCQAAWFGGQTFPAEPDDDPHDVVFEDEEAALELGPCCICGGRGAGNIILLPRRAAVPGHGWGCVLCGLPADGALAVLCGGCMVRYGEAPELLTHCCRGYPATDGSIAIAELPAGVFDHEMTKHTEET